MKKILESNITLLYHLSYLSKYYVFMGGSSLLVHVKPLQNRNLNLWWRTIHPMPTKDMTVSIYQRMHPLITLTCGLGGSRTLVLVKLLCNKLYYHSLLKSALSLRGCLVWHPTSTTLFNEQGNSCSYYVPWSATNQLLCLRQQHVQQMFYCQL